MNEDDISSYNSLSDSASERSGSPPPFESIEHIVVLMLENRSFDGTLGWLYEDCSPEINIPGCRNDDTYRGLQGLDLSTFTNTAEFGLSCPPIRGASGFTVPSEAPGEEFKRVNEQLFETESPIPHAVPTMKGFLQDFVNVMKVQGYNEDEIKASATMIMQTYTQAQMPVLNQLAKYYAVSDDWFASSPSQTNSNRAFLLTGSSEGLVDNGQLEIDQRAKKIEDILGMGIGDDRFLGKTIFNAIEDAGKDWGVFWQSSCLPHKIATLLGDGRSLFDIIIKIDPYLFYPLEKILHEISPYADYLTELTSGELSSCYTWRLFSKIQEIPNAKRHFKGIEDFHLLARSGKLPLFSFIEPSWTISHLSTDAGIENLFTQMGNDYHPPGNTVVSENFLKDIYESLISNKETWNKTLFVILFDEFVGSFDHITPPSAIPPGTQDRAKSGFQFDRYGARVPAILVSPLIQKGTVFRSPEDKPPYDHTSLISTILKHLGKTDQVGLFGERTKNAPTFDSIINLTQPRTDAGDIDFLNVRRNMGDAVRYRDPIKLKNQNGQYITAYQCCAKNIWLPSGDWIELAVDLNLAAYFPTIGSEQEIELMLLTNEADPPDQILDDASVFIVTLESGVGSANFLGKWEGTTDCYYYNNYSQGHYAENEIWIVKQVDNRGQPLRYGDKVYLENRHFSGQFLSKNAEEVKWIATNNQDIADYWVIEPAKKFP